MLGVAGYAWYERRRILFPVKPVDMQLSPRDREQLIKAYELAFRTASRHRFVLASVTAGKLNI